MADASDVVLEIWRDQRQAAVHSEDQRATLSNIVILVVAAGLGLISQRGIHASTLVISVPMIFLGLYGVLVCLKFRERFEYHNTVARQLRDQLTALHPELNVQSAWPAALDRHQSRYPKLFRVRLYVLWALLHAGVALAGGIVSAYALAK
ncbi:hypothetical protein GCM10023084_05440 [Streptomyces lacrimifluminis]|uniref:Uncharacterized protein n=1 Tax=Streptomyces lacrimifluminis TaxID=1500077 RepID=A0A917NS88_9ACTN|nr:hypothetical protein [Streptomyces lacrimifluminis]GGJ22837.1 hypothetical protein GCM10012282_19180 [Streptomyces lacrimifluminis]